MKDQDEMFEAATETPAFLGCPQHLPKTLPGGFNGTEPANDKEELQKRGAKLFACNERMRERIVEIAHLANECLLNTNHPNGYEQGQYGLDYRTYGKTISQIRKTCKESMVEECVPDYEWLAKIMTREGFDPECLAKAIEAEASQRPIDYPTFYTPGWLCELAKKLEGGEGVPPALSPTGADKRKPTMDFGRFHVTRAAIPGRTIITFRRKRVQLENFATVVTGRIIVADIHRADVGSGQPVLKYIAKSYMAGEKPRVLFVGDSWAGMSKTEKMVYKMVKCNIKETQRRRIRRKRAAAAKAAAATHS